jgi:hypothetical protein
VRKQRTFRLSMSTALVESVGQSLPKSRCVCSSHPLHSPLTRQCCVASTGGKGSIRSRFKISRRSWDALKCHLNESYHYERSNTRTIGHLESRWIAVRMQPRQNACPHGVMTASRKVSKQTEHSSQSSVSWNNLCYNLTRSCEVGWMGRDEIEWFTWDDLRSSR